MNANLLAKDIMSTDSCLLTEDMTVADAVELFSDRNMQGAPVLNASGKLVGFLSVHDVMVELWCQDYLPEHNQKVAELMKPVVVTVDANDPVVSIVEQLCIDKAQLYPISNMGISTISVTTALSVEERAKRMAANKPKILPVVNKGTFVGVITRVDVIKALRSVYAEAVDMAV